MKRRLPGGFEVDDVFCAHGDRINPVPVNLEEIDVDAVRDFGRQIGFARAVSDGASVTYLPDVYVLPEYRGRGLGVELVREMVENGPYSDKRWILHTADAHRLYEKFGFGPPSERIMERPRRTA